MGKHSTINTDLSKVVEYGVSPPKSTSYDEICPPPEPCPECINVKDMKCRDSINLFDLVGKLDIRPLGNVSFQDLPNRTLNCMLYAVGKPVYHRFTNLDYGSWLRDPAPKNEQQGERLWVTKEGDAYKLYEFFNKTAFRKDAQTRIYHLEHPFIGNAHVIYNGSFYYNARDKPRIIKFDLETERTHALNVPFIQTNDSANFLYTTLYNYMDFSVDDNGLWIIYGLPGSNNTAVLKIDSFEMRIQYAWNISINHHKVGEMFIVCGVLYGVDSVTERNSRIRLALDLYTSKLLEVDLTFTNPFRKTTMLGYNPRNKVNK